MLTTLRINLFHYGNDVVAEMVAVYHCVIGVDIFNWWRGMLIWLLIKN